MPARLGTLQRRPNPHATLRRRDSCGRTSTPRQTACFSERSERQTNRADSCAALRKRPNRASAAHAATATSSLRMNEPRCIAQARGVGLNRGRERRASPARRQTGSVRCRDRRPDQPWPSQGGTVASTMPTAAELRTGLTSHSQGSGAQPHPRMKLRAGSPYGLDGLAQPIEPARPPRASAEPRQEEALAGS
jgi:hypothetical protein